MCVCALISIAKRQHHWLYLVIVTLCPIKSNDTEFHLIPQNCKQKPLIKLNIKATQNKKIKYAVI
jgi:hypothetical protein